VSGGTLNTTGSFVMRAERVGRDTLLAQIIRLVEEAQNSEAPIQRLADKVAAWFVPAVAGIAAATFVLWLWLGPEPRWIFAFVNAVAVLIIACPCALGLATPVSLATGIGRGAQAGILVKNAEALERLAQATTAAHRQDRHLDRGQTAPDCGRTGHRGGRIELRRRHGGNCGRTPRLRGGGRKLQRTSAGPRDRRGRASTRFAASPPPKTSWPNPGWA